MNEKNKICCIIGEQLKQFPWKHECDPSNLYTCEYQSLLNTMLKKLIAQGYNYFICDGSNGAALDFAEEVIFLRDFDFPHIKLEIDIPYRNQARNWNKLNKNRYQEVIELADEVILISEEKTENCLRECNEYIVDKSNIAIVFLNEKSNSIIHTLLAYAKQKGIKTILLNLYTFISNIELNNELINLPFIKQNEEKEDINLLPLFEKLGKMQETQNKKRKKRKF